MSLIQMILIAAAVTIVGMAILFLIVITLKRRTRRVRAYVCRSNSRPFRPHATRRVKRRRRL
jgi:Na+-transporting methylmalonyl-CoA/oxaloacetate decarboxylase gamma subunit